MSRSIWKGPFLDFYLFKNKSIFRHQTIKIWSRRSVIPSSFIGKTVHIHNGKVFKKIYVTREKVGYKFGEFAFTRTYSFKSKKTTVKKKN